MIDRSHPALSVGAQCRLLSISRSSFYCAPQGETSVNLALMQLIDRQFLETPFYGVQQMTWHLRNEGHGVNVKRIRRLMRLMRLMPIYQKPNTSKPAKGHKTYPYLLGGLQVDRPNQVWCADITYLPMQRSFLYPVLVMDWFTRKVLALRISNTLEADFFVEDVNEAVHRFGPPEIMNSDQGSQFTSFAWTDRLKRIGTRISMDGNARAIPAPMPRPAPVMIHVLAFSWGMVFLSVRAVVSLRHHPFAMSAGNTARASNPRMASGAIH